MPTSHPYREPGVVVPKPESYEFTLKVWIEGSYKDERPDPQKIETVVRNGLENFLLRKSTGGRFEVLDPLGLRSAGVGRKFLATHLELVTNKEVPDELQYD